MVKRCENGEDNRNQWAVYIPQLSTTCMYLKHHYKDTEEENSGYFHYTCKYKTDKKYLPHECICTRENCLFKEKSDESKDN